MTARRAHPVKVYRQPKINERCELDWYFFDEHSPSGFRLTAEHSHELLAECHSAKRLTDWAFEHGAGSVRYEGRATQLSDGEA